MALMLPERQDEGAAKRNENASREQSLQQMGGWQDPAAGRQMMDAQAQGGKPTDPLGNQRINQIAQEVVAGGGGAQGGAPQGQPNGLMSGGAGTGVAQRTAQGGGTTQAYDPAQAQVAQGDTVAGRMSGLLNTQSDYMRSAETRAKQEMQRRGLLHSSYAIEAGQKAAIDRALPIASQDAQTSRDLALANQQATNQARSQAAAGDIESRLIGERGQIEKDLVDRRGQIEKDLQGADADTRMQLLQEQGQIDKQLTTLRGNIESGLVDQRGNIEKQLQSADAATREKLLQQQGQIDTQLTTLRGQIETGLVDRRGAIEKELQTAEGQIRMNLLQEQGSIDLQLTNVRGEIERSLVRERGDIDMKLQTAEGQIRMNLLQRQGQIDTQLTNLRGNIESRQIQERGKVEEGLIDRRGQISMQLQTAEGEIRMNLLREQGSIDERLQVLQQGHQLVMQSNEIGERQRFQEAQNAFEGVQNHLNREHSSFMQSSEHEHLTNMQNIINSHQSEMQQDSQTAALIAQGIASAGQCATAVTSTSKNSNSYIGACMAGVTSQLNAGLDYIKAMRSPATGGDSSGGGSGNGGGTGGGGPSGGNPGGGYNWGERPPSLPPGVDWPPFGGNILGINFGSFGKSAQASSVNARKSTANLGKYSNEASRSIKTNDGKQVHINEGFGAEQNSDGSRTIHSPTGRIYTTTDGGKTFSRNDGKTFTRDDFVSDSDILKLADLEANKLK